MTKKLSPEVKDARANLRLGKDHIREVNDLAEKLIHPQAGVQDSSTPLEYADHKDVIRRHELTGLAAVHAGDYGDDFKCLFYRTLNSMTQRVLRDAIRAELAEMEKPADDALNNVLSADELSELFGFEAAPLYTITQAAHWVMLTHTVGHAATMVTIADEQGFKSKPCAWMMPHFKTVNQMLYADMLYAISQSVGSQTAQLTKLDMPEAEVTEATEKYTEAQKATAMERFLTKKALVDGSYDRDYYKNLETDAELADLEDMIATLGLNVPALMTEVAQSYKDSKTRSARAGKYIGDIDERIVDLAPRTSKEERRAAIAKGQAPEAVTGEVALRGAQVEAEIEDTKRTAVASRKLQRVTKAQAQTMSLH